MRHGSDTTSPMGQDLRVLDGIASWCGALHGSMPLDEAIGALSQAISADLSILSRDARSDGKCRIVADYDVKKADRHNEKVRRAFAPDVLGEYYGKMRRGTSWFLSDHQDDFGFENTSGLASWRLARGIVDIVVVCLESTGLQQDYLEFHLANILSREAKEELEALLPTLVRAWSGRKTGLVTQAQMDDRMLQARAVALAARIKPDAPILGTSNPAKLSRAEFRVCLLLSRGLSVKGLTDELGSSEATVRSHLRSIYSKTEASGLPELVYRLLANGTDARHEGFGRV
jgi:DNA-binding CsgD family transcriptional regulator